MTPRRLALVWCLAMVATVSSLSAAGTKKTVVNDPHYGQVLYDFYQDKYFAALGTLMTEQHFGRFEKHADEAELLRGGLLLSYGVHLEAGKIFERLIAEGASPAVRDRAWFFLAKVRYQRGYLEEAEDALGRIGDQLAPELGDERLILRAFLLMKREKYDEAISVLKKVNPKSELARYGKFNLGVALVRSGQIDAGTQLLDEAGREPGRTEEFRALRDKTNVALGFAFLKEGNSGRARQALQRVRLEGLMSNLALLGMGWAHSAENQQERALVHWQELRDRNIQDAAVQESLLASSYALGKLGAWRKSLEQYEHAIGVYTRELDQIDRSIAAIRSGKLADVLIEKTPTEDLGWFWELRQLPDSPETRYLSSLLAGHDFHEALKNYRDLAFMSARLEQWSGDLGSYNDMLVTRRRRFAEKLPSVIGGKRDADFFRRRAERDQLAARIQKIADDDDAELLATSKDREQLGRMERIRGVLSLQTVDDETWERYRMVRGLLRWDMETRLPERLWQARKSLGEIDRSLEKSRETREHLQSAQSQMPARFEDFEKRIQSLEPRIRQLQRQSQDLAREQGQYIANSAIVALNLQRLRIATYLTQARFAVAQIYDQSSGQETESAP